jgi:modulator of FtsH protease HflK
MSKNIFEREVHVDLDRIRQIKVPPRVVPVIVGTLLLIILAFASVYQIQPEEVGVVMRFGRYTRTTEPGLQFKIPFLETVHKVPVQRQLKEEFGFRTADAAVRTRYSSQRFLDESIMLTGDLNVAVVEWTVQYRVADPYRYLFRVRNVTGTFRYMTEAVMREVVGDRTVTEVLTVGRQEIESTVQEHLQELTNQYEMGITVDQVVLQDVNPPDPVKPSWDAVNQAQQQRDRLINEALAEYNQVIPRARGEAQQALLEAEGYSLDRVNRSRGDAARFRSLHEAYRRSPQVTRQRLYLETMQRVMPKVGGKVFLDKEAKGILPLLHLERFEDLTSPGARKEVSR